jgi:cytochrome c-type biogenesis protein CcmH
MTATDDQPGDQSATPRSSRSLNKRLKSWPGWILMALVAITFLVVGATRTAGPQSQDDRVDDLSQRIACPVCDGESVFVSQNAASRRLRNQVEDLVRQNELSDEQILTFIDARNEGDLLLVPKASGLDALVWVLPAAGFVIGVTGLGLAFRRWKLEAEGLADPTEADRALVDAALAADDPTDPAIDGVTDVGVEDPDVEAEHR